jgi:hypothetical protein
MGKERNARSRQTVGKGHRAAGVAHGPEETLRSPAPYQRSLRLALGAFTKFASGATIVLGRTKAMRDHLHGVGQAAVIDL